MGIVTTQNCDVREEWERFVTGKPIDESKVSPIIYESWKRSKSCGVDPFKETVPEYSDTGALNDLQVPAVLNDFFRHQSKDLARKYGIAMSFFDKNGTIVADALTRFRTIGNNSEHLVGTNAAGLALVRNKPTLVLGYEHYAVSFHADYACASPVHNRMGETIGVLNILCRDPEQIEMAYVLLGSITEVINLSNKFDHEGNTQGNGFIEELLDRLPQGLACLDGNNDLIYHNERFLDMLKLGKTKDLKVELDRLVSGLGLSRGNGKKHASVNVNGITKSFLVSTREITSHNLPGNKLIVLEDGDTWPDSPGENGTIYTFDDIVGSDNRLLDAKLTARKVAQEAVPVLICGESGTGKEMFAQAIHNASPRRNGPFVAVNCGAIPTELAESELFGYEPGSFTGALRTGKQGQLELASGGTLFLDEIESMPLNIQVKLLRVLSERRLSKIGGSKVLPVDIRVISATKKDLLKESDCGAFREDLYYRISTITIDLPALRERKDDIPALVFHFLAQTSRATDERPLEVTREFLDGLAGYRWRGNVRELSNVVEGAVCLLDEGVNVLDAACLPERIRSEYAFRSVKKMLDDEESLKNNSDNLLKVGEEIIIRSVLEDTHHNYSLAARFLGISRKTLYNKIQASEGLYKGSRKH